MTAEERLKVRDWARRNLGKEVTYLYERMVGRSERHEALDGTDHVLPVSAECLVSARRSGEYRGICSR